MYNKHHKNNKPIQKYPITQLAQQIQHQTECHPQALSILNAYRKIENLPLSTPISHPKQPSKSLTSKPQSEYSQKIKQTLKQMNANRKKDSNSYKDIFKKNSHSSDKKNSPSEKYLMQSGLKHLFKVLEKKYQQNNKIFVEYLYLYGNSKAKQSQTKIKYWKLQRIFNAWQYQLMLTKIQKQRKQKQSLQKFQKQQQLAINFHYFYTIKTIFIKWVQQTKKSIKKKLIQQEQSKIQQEEYNRNQKQKKNTQQKKSQILTNIELQNKVRGLIDDLKLEVLNKDKPKTYQQQNSQQNYHHHEQNIENHNNEIQPQPNDNQPNIQSPQNQQNPIQIPSNTQPIEPESQHKTPLTNQDLEKRRKQLQKKAKHRKQTLDKLKRQKQQKKKQQQQQKTRIQKQIQIQQKKLRQQQYRKFLKQKRQQQQWLIKQKQITRQAIEFDRLRLMKFYGWIYWVKVKSINQSNIEHVLYVVRKAMMKRYLEKFCIGVTKIGQQKLWEIEKKMDRYHSRKLARKCLERLKLNLEIQLTQKQQYQAHHQVFTIKIYFNSWLQARQSIQLQNYQFLRPRIKKAQSLHTLTLLHKSFEGLLLNRDTEIQNKNIEQHKAKIKQKIHGIVEEKPTINYDQFL